MYIRIPKVFSLSAVCFITFLLLFFDSAIPSEEPRLLTYAMHGEAEMVETLLSQRIDVNTRNEDGETALTVAPTLKVVSLLIEKGADVDAKNKDGKTALMRACWAGANLIVKKLVDSGADVNARDKNGLTALIVASISGRVGQVMENWYGRLRWGINSADATDIVDLLVRHGADVNSRTSYGGTALMEASFNGHAEVIRYLIANKAQVNARNEDGETALMFARRKGHADIIRILQQAGAH